MAPWSRRKSKASTEVAAIVVHDSSAPPPPTGAGGANAVDQANAEREKAALQAQAAMEAEDLAEMLPLRKPKHMGDGVASGASLVIGGVVSGAAALIAMPAMGAREGAKAGGAKGAAKGFAAGLARGVGSAVVLPVAGAGAGTAQVLRGVAQTPFAVAGAAKGKQWDTETRKWRHYELSVEEDEVKEADAEWTKKLAARREALRAATGKSAGVEDSSFYDLLDVAHDASTGDVKRAYMKKAMKMHPDKNRDDPQATAKFQKLGEAYQVLSNDDARARYDAKGMDGLDERKFMDSTTMFAMLFGSEKFDELVGELQLAAMLQQAEAQQSEYADLKHMSHKQRQREVLCARKLADRLQPYVDYQVDQATFEAEARAQATELAQNSFGELLTHTIGRIYVFKASQALKLSITEGLRMRRHTFGQNAQALKAMMRLYKLSKEAQGLKEEEQQKAISKHLPDFLETAWYCSVVDVEATLFHVCKKVLTDTALARDGRKRRAQALKRLGEIYLEAVSEESKKDGKTKTLRERLAEAMPAEAFAGAPAGAPAAEDDDDDAFPDLDAAEGDEGGSSSAADAAPVASREVLQAMSVRELRAVMVAQGLSPEGLLEKSEFVDAIMATMAASEPSRV